MWCDVDVVQYRDTRCLEADRGDILRKTIRGWTHQGAVRRYRDRQRQCAFGARLLGEFHGPLYGTRVARNYHLTGRIEIDRADHVARGGAFANGDDLIVVKTEDGSHRAATFRHRVLHVCAALCNQAYRSTKLECAGAHQCRVFSQAVSSHQRGGELAAALPATPGGDTGRQHRRLSARGLVEQLCGTLPGSFPEIVTEHGRCFGKGLLDRRKCCRQLGQHADGL